MIEFGGNYYYVDLEALDELIASDESLQAKELEDVDTIEYFDADGKLTKTKVVKKKYTKGKEVDGARYDIINFMLQVVLSPMEEMDDTLGAARALSNAPLNYKIAFNTLLEFGVLKMIEED